VVPAEAQECRHGAASGAGLMIKGRREAKVDEEGDVIGAWIAFLACLQQKPITRIHLRLLSSHFTYFHQAIAHTKKKKTL